MMKTQTFPSNPNFLRLRDVPNGTIIIIAGVEKIVRRKGGKIVIEYKYHNDLKNVLTYGLNCQMWVEVIGI